ncbi:NAD(P)-binding protein [Aspergillus steynii IBT 23096]|uniref:NAD(P)-binding protein n=1 Tax=Aspergillus steynii IBT 23096 TaxID=1392250 RepID=A0A2I2GPI3_9EURO|nr:NAD(P)-binding protein [Aspergillus steynii IBT 23096]PLB54791.1 NAD(P)-binding protein [Aspergillus steynii IBT 23096]
MSAVLITGATGKQGGALIRSLVQRKAPFEILAKLASLSKSIKLIQGDLDNPAGIFKNAQRVTKSPIWGVYSVQTAIGNKSEEPQGKALIDESITQNVKFFIYSSVDRGGETRSFSNPTKTPHFIKKHNIEQHLLDRAKAANMDWTILRPVAFYENLTPDFFGKVFATCFKMALAGKPLQMVATSDIGYFGAQAFLNPEEYKGRAISLAGDELTFEGMGLVFEQKVGRPLPLAMRPICSFFMAVMKDMGYMFKWLREEGYKADIAALKGIHPEMKDFATWLEAESGFKR